MSALQDILRGYGVGTEQLVVLGEAPSAEALRYASLFAARGGLAELARVQGVVHWQDEPLAYVADGQGLGEDGLRRLRRALALRGDALYLALHTPGQLALHRLGLDDQPPSMTLVRSAQPRDPDAGYTFPWLSAAPDRSGGHRRVVSELLFELLQGALKDLQAQARLAPEDGISLVGRALFLRFLADRGRLPPGWGPDPGLLFDSVLAAQRASAWLDETFNGELLPLGPQAWAALGPEALVPLRDILRAAPGGQLSLDWAEDWMHVHFAHIPVGVLGEVYERFLHLVSPAAARASSVHYTPWRIAERMVAESFAALHHEGRAADARVLDPAVGAGVFLLLSFRQLVAAYARRDGRRPDGAALRRILAEQLHGLDVHEGALRLAALGLYLLCLELEPAPPQGEGLRFPNLRQTTLTRVDERTGGSLGPEGAGRHLGAYDLVIGNPPWTASTRAATQPVRAAERALLDAATARLGRPVTLPGKAPELAFLLRALEWAREGGHLALALHGRLLLQQTEGMPALRAALWAGVEVTGVVNGALLRNSPVWKIGAQWCLLFARNRPTGPFSAALVVQPAPEPALSPDGRMRLSPDQARWVRPEEVGARPELFKALLRGSALDLELLARLPPAQTLGALWQARGLAAGNGFQRRRASTRGAGHSGEALRGRPVLTAGAGRSPEVRVAELHQVEQLAPQLVFHRLRDLAIYRGPLLLVSISPKAKDQRLDVRVCTEDLVYDQDFYGWSAAGQPEAERLVHALALLLKSRLSLWLVLLRSGNFGVHREFLESASLAELPVVPPEDMPPALREAIEPLWARLAAAPQDAAVLAAVDRWAAQVYGLDDAALAVIHDTLDMGLPFTKAKERSVARLSAVPAHFTDALRDTLQPWAEAEGLPLELTPVPALPPDLPWLGLHLRCPRPGAAARPPAELPWAAWVALADATGVGELVQPTPDGLVVLRLAYARGWTASRGRLLGQRLVAEHLDALLGEPR